MLRRRWLLQVVSPVDNIWLRLRSADCRVWTESSISAWSALDHGQTVAMSAFTQRGNDMSEGRDTNGMTGRSETLQVLLTAEEHEELERLAASRGLSTSAVAREAILRLVRAEAAPRSAADLRLAQDWQIYP